MDLPARARRADGRVPESCESPVFELQELFEHFPQDRTTPVYVQTNGDDWKPY
jgi:hypothetical protein